MGNAEATPHAAGESVEAIRRGSDELEHDHADCATARRPASNTVINTPHEALFHQALIRARLSFETQSHPAGDRYEADIELLQKPIVIEVTNSPGENRAKPRREAKTAALEAAGYRVYWFSNHQARTDPDAAIRRVMRENGLVREAAPTMLVRANRTGHVGPLNPNWAGGPATTPCEQCGTPVTAGTRNGGKNARFCSSKCYGEWMHIHPEAVKSKRLTLDWDEAERLYADGMSCEQVGERLGCSTSAVKVNLRKRGVLRPIGGYRPKGGFYTAGEAPGS
jgi:very-short-patch-repair endonuclease/endogenous inhibitor of DNA gyrase (YacG/DUF329 family)